MIPDPEATRLANTPASRSKQAPQLSPRAALPALCRLGMPANVLSFSGLLMLGCTLGNTLMCVTCWLSGGCWAWRVPGMGDVGHGAADVGHGLRVPGMEGTGHGGRGYRVWRAWMPGRGEEVTGHFGLDLRAKLCRHIPKVRK